MTMTIMLLLHLIALGENDPRIVTTLTTTRATSPTATGMADLNSSILLLSLNFPTLGRTPSVKKKVVHKRSCS
jgi:hypothetical protein